MNPAPSCRCGTCPLCLDRHKRAQYYRAHRARIIKANTAYQKARRLNDTDNLATVARLSKPLESTDEELDRKALLWLECRE
jgi:hypothetical protein